MPDGQRLSDDFHTYPVDWSPYLIMWSIDGQTYATHTPLDIGMGYQWVYDHPFSMILNVEVGENFSETTYSTMSFQ
ncbi:family 16 glycosylhydrolase [Rhodococcus sp. NPDC049939]|uniref:family 16 glycosylhydrolase n=1 Tax=Rhodococcus sp. NPDC049939 TaxID=3155511 RepID=UPI0033E539F7